MTNKKNDGASSKNSSGDGSGRSKLGSVRQQGSADPLRKRAQTITFHKEPKPPKKG